MESGDAETLGLQRNSQLKRVFNEAQQGRDCVQQCLLGPFPAHQRSDFREPIVSHCAGAGSLRPGFASWKGTHRSECAKSSSRNSQHCLKRGSTATLWADAPYARQGAIACPSGAAGHHSLGAAAGAVWGEQSQLDLWGWAGVAAANRVTSSQLGDAWPGRRSSPGYPEGWAAAVVVFYGAEKGSHLWLWDSLHKGHSWLQSGSVAEQKP